jgi:hypothetical protein
LLEIFVGGALPGAAAEKVITEAFFDSICLLCQQHYTNESNLYQANKLAD